MARVELRLPQFGMGMADATVIEWHHQVGDAVREGELLMVAETAKANVDVEAPATGTLVEAYGNPGDVVLTGDLLAVVETA